MQLAYNAYFKNAPVSHGLSFAISAFESCKRRILAINGLSGLSSNSDDEHRMIYFSSLLNFDAIFPMYVIFLAILTNMATSWMPDI